MLLYHQNSFSSNKPEIDEIVNDSSGIETSTEGNKEHYKHHWLVVYLPL